MVKDSTLKHESLYFDIDGSEPRFDTDELLELAASAAVILESGNWDDVPSYEGADSAYSLTGHQEPRHTQTFRNERVYDQGDFRGKYLTDVQTEYIVRPQGVSDAVGVWTQVSLINREEGEGLDRAAKRHHEESKDALGDAVEREGIDEEYEWL